MLYLKPSGVVSRETEQLPAQNFVFPKKQNLQWEQLAELMYLNKKDLTTTIHCVSSCETLKQATAAIKMSGRQELQQMTSSLALNYKELLNQRLFISTVASDA